MKGTTCFSILPFKDTYLDRFNKIVKPIVESHTGLVYEDGLTHFEGNTIKMERLRSMIEACRIVIADISEINPNVFLEIGVAFELQKPIILLCDKTSFDNDAIWKSKLPFDLGGREAILFANDVDLKVKLAQAVMDATRETVKIAVTCEPIIHTGRTGVQIMSPSEMSFFRFAGDGTKPMGRATTPIPVGKQFTIKGRVTFSDGNSDGNIDRPDFRITITPTKRSLDPPDIFPRIRVILPWEDDNTYHPGSPLKCVIDWDNAPPGNLGHRIQEVKIGNNVPTSFEFSVVFSWPNLVVESSLFTDIERLVVPLEAFRVRQYPLHARQYISFEAMTTPLTLSELEIREIEA